MQRVGDSGQLDRKRSTVKRWYWGMGMVDEPELTEVAAANIDAQRALKLHPHADTAGRAAGAPEAHADRPEDAPLDGGADHQGRG